MVSNGVLDPDQDVDGGGSDLGNDYGYEKEDGYTSEVAPADAVTYQEVERASDHVVQQDLFL